MRDIVSTPTAAKAIANGLAAAGCKHAFGMPGGEVLVLLEALDSVGIHFTLCKHENAAGFMAEGSWQATGAPGILLTTIGPGLANGVNSIANACQEQVPMIVLSGCIAPAQAAEFTHQVIDQSALMAPITKARFQITAGSAAQTITQALDIARADPPGPVHIDLPDSLAQDVTPESFVGSSVQARAIPGSDAKLETAVARLKSSKRPLILAGIGAVLHNAGPAIVALSEAHNIPVITTYKAKGVIPENHPNSLGGHGLSPLSGRTILPLLGAADCILLMGYDPIEMRSDWIRPWQADAALDFPHAKIDHGMHGNALQIVGDVAASARALSKGLQTPLTDLWPDGEPAKVRANLQKTFAPGESWGAHAVFAALDRELPDNAVVTADSGAHRILLTQMWHSNRPGHLLQSSAFCTMGISVPLAIGYKCAKPQTQLVAVVGDAGMDMTAGELATLRDMKLPLTIIVLVDDTLTLIERKQSTMQLPELGVGFGATNFPALARAYGGYGTTITDSKQFSAALNAARSREVFSILACRIKKEDYDEAF
ncbi:MAG: thiamine pyrophosphate-binding protein [Paracoccaceae bacterium]